jgi:hypothetical protein
MMGHSSSKLKNNLPITDPATIANPNTLLNVALKHGTETKNLIYEFQFQRTVEKFSK